MEPKLCHHELYSFACLNGSNDFMEWSINCPFCLSGTVDLSMKSQSTGYLTKGESAWLVSSAQFATMRMQSSCQQKAAAVLWKWLGQDTRNTSRMRTTETNSNVMCAHLLLKQKKRGPQKSPSKHTCGVAMESNVWIDERDRTKPSHT